MVDGALIIRATPRVNLETGEQVEGYDPDPLAMTNNLRVLKAAEMVSTGWDPLLAWLAAGPPIVVGHGSIRYIQPRKREEL